MAARAKARSAAAQEQEQLRLTQRRHAARLENLQRPWLHGWRRSDNGLTVWMAGTSHCVGCGLLLGTACVVIEEGWEPPGPDPVWPFTEADCPVCLLEGRPDSDNPFIEGRFYDHP